MFCCCCCCCCFCCWLQNDSLISFTGVFNTVHVQLCTECEIETHFVLQLLTLHTIHCDALNEGSDWAQSGAHHWKILPCGVSKIEGPTPRHALWLLRDTISVGCQCCCLPAVIPNFLFDLFYLNPSERIRFLREKIRWELSHQFDFHRSP
jgi:hypothetical protein